MNRKVFLKIKLRWLEFYLIDEAFFQTDNFILRKLYGTVFKNIHVENIFEKFHTEKILHLFRYDLFECARIG